MKNNDNELNQVELDNYELQPLDNTDEELPQEELDNVNFFDELDNYNEQPSDDKVNNEVVEDFVKEPSSESELYPTGYTTEQVTDQNVSSIPEDLPENNRPLDNFVLNNYDDDKDRGELIQAIASNDDNKVEEITETNPELVENTPELENTPLEKEAEQITSDTDKTNDEVNNEAVKETFDKMQKRVAGSSFLNVPPVPEDETIIDEKMANTEPLSDDNFEPAPEAPYADNVAQIKTDIDKRVENAIENNPTVAEQIAENVSGENSPIENEAEQLNDSNPNNDEVSNEAIEQTPIKEKQEILDKLNNEAAEDTAGLIDWDKVKVYEPGEDTTGYGIQQEPFDPRVEENLNYDYDQNIPTFETSITDTTQDFSPDSSVVDYGLEDQNQYGADLPSEDETIIDEKMANTEPLSDDNFEPAPEAPYADNVVQLKQQKEQLDKELEEAEAEPVTDKESAIRKQNRVKMARAAIANFHASNPNFNNQVQQSNGSVSTGGRVSPSAGIGSIGGGASGHGSMSPVNTRRTDNAINVGKAGGGAMPVTLGHNSSKVIQPSRSFSNGSLSSGSFGLMSKNKGNGAFSSKPMSLPNGESSSVVEGVNVDSIVDSGKDALIERLETLLDKLSPEQRKQLGFSPKEYNYQGERFEDLDGYTIQKLLEEVERLVG